MKFEANAAYQRWDEEDKLVNLMAALEGTVSPLLHSCKGKLTYNNLLESLRQRYGSEGQIDRYRQELSIRVQKPGESLNELVGDLERIAALAYPDVTPEFRDKLFCLPAFIRAMADPDL